MSAPPDLSNARVQCPACRSPLAVGREVDLVEERCPVCRAEVFLALFPRLYGEFAPVVDEAAAGAGEATCSFYPDLRAESVCDQCGCFLSHRAATRWSGRDLCLPCLHRLREIEHDPGFVPKASLRDRQALTLVTWFAPFTLATAPIALFLLFRQRGKAPGFEPRGNTTWWIACVLAMVWTLVWLGLIGVWATLVLEGFT